MENPKTLLSRVNGVVRWDVDEMGECEGGKSWGGGRLLVYVLADAALLI